MKKFLEAVLAKHKHMAKTASPHHPHSQALVYTPGGKEEIRPIDTADAGYGGEAVADAQGGEANAGKASKKAVSPMKMQTLEPASIGGAKKKSNGHKATCACPICVNMMAKKKGMHKMPDGKMMKDSAMTKMAKGGGIESKGKTKGKMIKMMGGGKC